MNTDEVAHSTWVGLCTRAVCTPCGCACRPCRGVGEQGGVRAVQAYKIMDNDR